MASTREIPRREHRLAVGNMHMVWLRRYRRLAVELGLASFILGMTGGPSFAAQIDQSRSIGQIVSEQRERALSLSNQVMTAGGSSPAVIDARSSGGTSQADVDPPGPWRLQASWTCPDPDARFTLQVQGADGSPVDRISGGGTREVTRDYPGGQHYHLEIRSTCPWHLVVQS